MTPHLLAWLARVKVPGSLARLALLPLASTIGMSFGGFPCPAAAQSVHPFPGHLEDLSPGLYWYWGQSQHPPGANQGLGHDLSALQFDEEAGKFLEFAPDRTKNENYFIYGIPVYAIADGEVLICWRNAPENAAPDETHPARAEDPPRIFGGGNFLIIEHTSGEVALYAHFQPGTVPTELCPNNDEFHPAAGNDWNAAVPAGSTPRVERGDLLGWVGNSGASSAPHLHISLHQGTSGGSVAPGPAAPLRFDAFRHKSSALTRDLASDWEAETEAVLPPGPIVILPTSSNPPYPPAAWIGKPWSEFLAQWQAFEREGYRLHDFETYVTGGRRLYAGIFQPGTYQPAAWVGKPWDEFLSQWQAFEREGYRLHDFEAYVDGGRRLYAGIFQPGSYQPAAWIGKPWNEFLSQWQAFERQGYRLHDFETYVDGGRRLYAGIFQPGSYQPAAWIGKPWNEFLSQWQAFESQGYRLHDFETYVDGGRRLYAGIFQPGTYQPAAWIGKPWNEFLTKWGQLENLDYRLHDLEVYEGAEGLLYGGIFQGHQPLSIRGLQDRVPGRILRPPQGQGADPPRGRIRMPRGDPRSSPR